MGELGSSAGEEVVDVACCTVILYSRTSLFGVHMYPPLLLLWWVGCNGTSVGLNLVAVNMTDQLRHDAPGVVPYLLWLVLSSQQT